MRTASKTGGRGKVRWSISAMVAVSICASTCAGIPPLRPSVAPIATNPCEDAAVWQDNLRILQPNTVLRVEAHYTRNTCDGTTQVIGTRVLLRSAEGPSRAALSWMLQCRAWRIFVGQADPSSFRRRSPWLPTGWLDIEAKPEGDNLVVMLSADSVPKNIELFRRTAELVSAH
jgi:hypothetical protein